MRLKTYNESQNGLTRVELLFALVSVSLLGALGLSVLGSTAARSDLVVCANNLRQVGRAFNMWASDHGGENPWWTSYTDGGSYIRSGGPEPPGNILNVPGAGARPTASRNNAWLQFAYISEELRTPALLLCPTDGTKQRAQAFSNNSANGYFSLNFQNRSTSYFIGVHALSQFPATMLSGDRSLKEDGVNAACSANVGTLSMIQIARSGWDPPLIWSSELHVGTGNLLLNDGAVAEFSAAGLVPYLRSRASDNSSDHILKPN